MTVRVTVTVTVIVSVTVRLWRVNNMTQMARILNPQTKPNGRMRLVNDMTQMELIINQLCASGDILGSAEY